MPFSVAPTSTPNTQATQPNQFFNQGSTWGQFYNQQGANQQPWNNAFANAANQMSSVIGNQQILPSQPSNNSALGALLLSGLLSGAGSAGSSGGGVAPSSSATAIATGGQGGQGGSANNSVVVNPNISNTNITPQLAQSQLAPSNFGAGSTLPFVYSPTNVGGGSSSSGGGLNLSIPQVDLSLLDSLFTPGFTGGVTGASNATPYGGNLGLNLEAYTGQSLNIAPYANTNAGIANLYQGYLPTPGDYQSYQPISGGNINNGYDPNNGLGLQPFSDY